MLPGPLVALLGGAVATAVTGRFRRVYPVIACAAIVVALVLATGLVPWPFKPSPLFKEDSLTRLMSTLFCVLALIAAIHSIDYLVENEKSFRYYVLLLTLTGGMVAVVHASNLFTLYVAWELMALSSYALVSYRSGTWEAVEAGFKYLVLSTIGSLAALLGVTVAYGYSGTLSIESLVGILTGADKVAQAAALLAIVGFGVTAALVPFHTWLPDAHPAAPSPISAMLSGVVIKTAAYSIALLIFLPFRQALPASSLVLLALGVLTMTVGNLMVPFQRDIKRFLAYSSIANMGYIITGFGVAARLLLLGREDLALLGLTGSLFHIVNHALGKGLAFMGAGNMIHEVGTRDLSKLKGIARRMPVTGLTMSLSLLHLAGVPPLAGFWSKLLIASAAAALLEDPLLAAVVVAFVLNWVFAAGYYLWLIQHLTLYAPSAEANEAPITMVAAVSALAALIVALTAFLGPTLLLVKSASGVFLAGW